MPKIGGRALQGADIWRLELRVAFNMSGARRLLMLEQIVNYVVHANIDAHWCPIMADKVSEPGLHLRGIAISTLVKARRPYSIIP